MIWFLIKKPASKRLFWGRKHNLCVNKEDTKKEKERHPHHTSPLVGVGIYLLIS